MNMAHDIVVYATPFCAPCERLKKFLQEKQVPFRSVDLMMDEEAAERLEDLGIRSSPVLEVDGRCYHGGQLQPDTLAALLGLP
ncbi:glutaredoxin family protein [Bordetella bronchiseptica]|uniref:glutaredoxin family protein n=1 Tax=Bordetella bronchiseptica TaxID=518 RepID=UPI0004617284|nr:glutaredoxin family protein [Bordetella bronchiseptica]KDD17660.1 glutaredoxin [Bordetella bronchiseptica MBORD707]